MNLSAPAPGVLGNDTDADGDPLIAILVAGPANGALTLNADGSFAYQPTPSFSGTDSFSYRANDGTADSNVVTVTITVTPSGCTGLCVSIADASLTEGTGGKVSISFTLSLTGTIPPRGRVTVQASTRDGTATAGADYLATSSRITFRFGQTTRTFTVRLVADGALEPNETFFVDLSAPVGGGIADGLIRGATPPS